MQAVLRAIAADVVPDAVFKFRRDRMLACVHVGDICVLQTLRELCPGLVGDVVCLADVDAPNLAFGGL